MRRIFSTIVIISHIVSTLTLPKAQAAQMESDNYVVAAQALISGSKDNISSSADIPLNTIGEGAQGECSSANYNLLGGYAAQVKASPPLFKTNIPYQLWNKGSSLTNAFDLDDYFASFEFGPGDLSYTVNGNKRINVNIDAATHLVSFSQPSDFSGIETISFVASDPDGNLTRSRPVKLLVKGERNPPLINLIDDIAASEGNLITITPTAVDIDGDAVTFSFSYPFDSAGKWQTNYNDAGEYAVVVTAKDSLGLSDTLEVKIRVNNVNRPPVLEPIANITANEGELVAVYPRAHDPDSDPIIFTFSPPLNSQGKWQTNYTDHGVRTITVTAYDGNLTASQDVSITINDVPQPPVMSASLSSNVVNPNASFTINIQASDPDNDTMVLKIEKDAEIIVDDQPISGSYQTTASFADIGDHKIKITVTDSTGRAAVMTLPVEVLGNVDTDKIRPIEGDFNGDGFTDTGIYNKATGEWKVSLSLGGNFIDRTIWLSGFGDSAADWTNIGGDFNGDGKTDVGIYNKDNGEFQIAASDGAKFVSQGKAATIYDGTSSTVPLSGDFNGDGLTDIGTYNYRGGVIKIALSKGGTFAYASVWMDSISTPDERIPILGDFNGDGLTDLGLFKKSSGEIAVALSYGKKFTSQSTWLSGFASNKDLLAADFNNDGLTDLGYKDNSSGNWYAAFSTGLAFQNEVEWYSNFGSGSDNIALTGDFNGDGVTDIATFNKNNSGLAQWNTEPIDNQTSDLLDEIDNGIGGKTQIEYAESSEYANSSLPFPLQVVKKVSTIDTKPDGNSYEIYIQESRFEGGYFDPEDREFRGFRKATVTDPITGNYSETYFYQGLIKEDDPLKGQIEKIIACDKLGAVISETNNRYENTEGGTRPNVVNFVHLAETESTVYEGPTQVTVKTTFVYDNVGNIIEEVGEGDVLRTGDEKYTFVTYAPPYEFVSAEEGGFNKALESRLEDSSGKVFDKRLFKYNERGNLTRQENVYIEDLENSPVTRFAYDDYGNTTQVTNANEHTVITQYENIYHIYPERITNELDHSIAYAYDPRSGLVVSITDANSNTTTAAYDALYRKIEERNTDNQVVTTYAYPDFNTVRTTQLGIVTEEYIDGLGRKYRTITSGEDEANARQVSSERFFDNRGHLEYEALPHYIDEDPGGISYVRYEYDAKGRIIKITNDFPGADKDGYSTISYPGVLTKTLTDAKENTKAIKTDVYGNTLEITEYIDGTPHTTQYEYDIKGNLKNLTDANGSITEIFYDSLGRKTKLIDPDTGITQYTYDKMGNLFTQTDNKDQVITFLYDGLSRVMLKSYSTNDPPVIYTYDEMSSANSIGRLTTIEDASGVTKYGYDKEGRITKSDRIIDGITYTFQTQYDILGRVINMTYPDKEVVNYTYDTNSGLLETVKGQSPGSPQGTVPYAHDITYNAKGQMRKIALGNGTQTDYTYAADLFLSRIYTHKDTTPLQDLNYIFDNVGNIASIEDKLTGLTKTYTYDSLNRLLTATNLPDGKGSLGTIFYKYNAIGNITYKSDVGNYAYGENGAGPHAVTSIRPVYAGQAMMMKTASPLPYGPPIEGAANLDFAYDSNGNMISKAGSVISPYAGNKVYNLGYQYDAENRLKKVIADGREAETYVYNSSGNRVKKIDQGGTTIYIGKLYETRTVNGEIEIIKHIFAGSQRVCSVDTTINDVVVPGEPGYTVATYYYHPDHLGSTDKVSNNAGQLVNSIEYTPFGQTAKDILYNGQIARPTSYLFTGKELDTTGLYYYGARYYDPLIGRFITADPTVSRPYDPQDLNRYSYCRNNPLVYTDPSGLSWLDDLWDWIEDIFEETWEYIVGGAVIIGSIMVAAATGGLASPMVPYIIGEVIGGMMGGITAAFRGADAGTGFVTGVFSGGFMAGVMGGVAAAGSAGTNIGMSAAQSAALMIPKDVALSIGYSIPGALAQPVTQIAAEIAVGAGLAGGAAAGLTPQAKAASNLVKGAVSKVADISISSNIYGEGRAVSLITGEEQQTKSLLNVGGGSLDISLGIMPESSEKVVEYGGSVGVFSIGMFLGRPNVLGEPQVGGIAFHVGFGLDSPIYISETGPIESVVKRPLSSLRLYYERLRR
ncbi:MAG: toxin TcdB middle/N-terminal domain-containing protein [Candidatus Omnitrophica bacterium]|nr:toxin TcdB middle/N-terminal domain-containing protein [Candidatus Omnitrophota bacterium]